MIETNTHRAQLTAKVLAGKAFRIKTPVCIQLFAHLHEWLSIGTMGAVVYGRPRLGKTMATRWVLGSLREVFGDRVPWIEVSVRREIVTSERAFFQNILLSLKHKYYNRGTAADRRDRTTEALLARACRSPIRTVILFFDEAQLLNEAHYYWILNASNELERTGHRLFSLFVGQHQLVHRRSTFLAEGLEEIIARFMTEDWQFPGLSSADDVRRCLVEYEFARYPEKDGIPFVEHFVDKAHNLSIADAAEPLWAGFSGLWSAAGYEGNAVVPMHYLSSTLCALLNDLGRDRHRSAFMISEETAKRAIVRSGYKRALVALSKA